jgi:hypothetical protein
LLPWAVTGLAATGIDNSVACDLPKERHRRDQENVKPDKIMLALDGKKSFLTHQLVQG